MKRGRPNIRSTIQSTIIEILSQSNTPQTVSSVNRFVSKKLGKTISWNTIQKYLNELVGENKVKTIQLPHSKEDEKIGLVVYLIEKQTV